VPMRGRTRWWAQWAQRRPPQALRVVRAAVVWTLVVAGVGAVPQARATIARTYEGFGLLGTVGIVRGQHSDRQAEQVVRQTLSRAGVTRVVVTTDRDPRTPTTIWLGEGRSALANLGVEPASGLPADGYVLAVGKDLDGRKHVVLDGADPDGTFYAARDLARSIVSRPDGPDFLPATVRVETPAMRYRGVVEGFYGTSWSHEDRLALLDFMGAHRMNTYVYAPKADPYLRSRWRSPFPERRTAELADLVRYAAKRRVDVGIGLSPGGSICFGSRSHRKALVRKLDEAYQLGVRSFTLAFDDIDPTAWHCASDRRTYGDRAGGAGIAQADLLNRLRKEWVPHHPGASLWLMPTEYEGLADSPYRAALRQHLDESVGVYWTGVATISRTISRHDAAEAARLFGREVVVWDNFPANDYNPGRLPLAAYTGREPGLGDAVAGLLSNPMNQAAWSRIGLASVADFTWDDQSYHPIESWRRALAEITGGDPAAADALERIADLNTYDGTLHGGRAPELSQSLAMFWEDWNSGDRTKAYAELRRTLRALAAAPALLRSNIHDLVLMTQGKAWLDATEDWAKAMLASLDALVAVDRRDLSEAIGKRAEAARLAMRASRVRDVTQPHASTSPLVGDGVVDAFVDRVDSMVSAAVGVAVERPQVSTSLEPYAGDVPDHMVDGRDDARFTSDRPPQPDDYVQVDLRRVRPIGTVTITMGHSHAPKNVLRHGVLEYSPDGSTWVPLAEGRSDVVRAHPGPDTHARYLRYRALEPNDPYWLTVREFQVEVLDQTRLQAGLVDSAGGPESSDGAEDGAALQDVVDDDLDTGVRLVASEAGLPPLVVTLSQPRRVVRVGVVQDPHAAGDGTLEVRRGDRWVPIGEVTGTYTELAVPQQVASDALRVTWNDDAAGPLRIMEIVPHFGPA